MWIETTDRFFCAVCISFRKWFLFCFVAVFYLQCQRILVIMQEKYQNIPAKYDKLYQPEELGLLDYERLIESNEFDYVYKPNDDTFLMLSTLRQEVSSFPPDLFLCELGSGSGIISANVHHWLRLLGNEPAVHLSVDINIEASLLSQKYFEEYQLNISQVNASLFNSFAFLKRIEGEKPNLIIFNPPYVPVEQEQLDNERKYLEARLKYVRQKGSSKRQQDQNIIAYSYMGGLDGLAITRKILKQIFWKSTFYFIVMGKEGFQQIDAQIRQGRAFCQNFKLTAKLQIMQYEQFFNEHLFVLKLSLQ